MTVYPRQLIQSVSLESESSFTNAECLLKTWWRGATLSGSAGSVRQTAEGRRQGDAAARGRWPRSRTSSTGGVGGSCWPARRSPARQRDTSRMIRRYRWLMRCRASSRSPCSRGSSADSIVTPFSALFCRLPLWFYCRLSRCRPRRPGAVCVALVARAARSPAREVSLSTAVRQYFIGIFVNNFLPSTVGGDLAKVYYIGRAARLSRRRRLGDRRSRARARHPGHCSRPPRPGFVPASLPAWLACGDSR